MKSVLRVISAILAVALGVLIGFAGYRKRRRAPSAATTRPVCLGKYYRHRHPHCGTTGV